MLEICSPLTFVFFLPLFPGAFTIDKEELLFSTVPQLTLRTKDTIKSEKDPICIKLSFSLCFKFCVRHFLILLLFVYVYNLYNFYTSVKGLD